MPWFFLFSLYSFLSSAFMNHARPSHMCRSFFYFLRRVKRRNIWISCFEWLSFLLFLYFENHARESFGLSSCAASSTMKILETCLFFVCLNGQSCLVSFAKVFLKFYCYIFNIWYAESVLVTCTTRVYVFNGSARKMKVSEKSSENQRVRNIGTLSTVDR